MNIRPVILAGGEGKRLAPLSTLARAKPFVPLPDGQSLLEKTLRRLSHPAFLPPVIVGNAKDRYALLNHARAAGVKPAAILLEDAARNTAIAVAAAAYFIHSRWGDEMLAFLPADHVIEDAAAWQDALIKAASLASTHQCLSLMGMCYQHFSAELGYLHLEGENITRFVEKPISEEELGSSGQYLVNSGQFIGTSGIFSQVLAHKSPNIWAAAQESVNFSQNQWEYTHLNAPITAFDAISFDKAVLEKAVPLTAIAADCGWRDLGTLKDWLEYTNIPLDKQLDGCTRIDRPWGYYELLEHTNEQAIKRLYIFPKCRLSRQRHFYRSEHWTIESGTAHVEKDEQRFTMGIYESIKIQPATWHRVANPTEAMLIIKEIQYGISDEMDIERIEDDYGRI